MGSMFQGLQGSRDRGLPLVDRGFQRVWRFQNPWVSGKYIGSERSPKNVSWEGIGLHLCPWDDLENYYLVRFQEVLTPVRVSGVGTGGDTVRSPSN